MTDQLERTMTEDEQLVRATLRGETSAFGAIVERYWNMIVAPALTKMGDLAEAEDVAQESFLRAYSYSSRTPKAVPVRRRVEQDRHPTMRQYLRAQIVSDRRKPVRLNIYTGDGVKAWLNGKLNHENNVARGIPAQPDAVNVTLNEDVNHLMLKVTPEVWGWQATVTIGSDSDKAVSPRPTDKARHPKTLIQLGWTPAAIAQSHRIYFGTDSNDLPLLAEVSKVPEPPPVSLEEGHRYYWRVDEVLTDGSIAQGDVWSFTIGTLVAWWTFAALTVDPEQATIYMHDGTSMKSATHSHGHSTEDFEDVTYIGYDPRWGTVKGAIDEVRIYNETLDAREIEAIYLQTTKTP